MRGEPVYPVFMQANARQLRVIEGMHRAVALLRIGCASLPAFYVCRAEDDHAEDDYGDDAEALVADYSLAGWREVRRLGLALCPPKKGRAAS